MVGKNLVVSQINPSSTEVMSSVKSGLMTYYSYIVLAFSFGDKTEMFRPAMVEPSPEYLEATWK